MKCVRSANNSNVFAELRLLPVVGFRILRFRQLHEVLFISLTNFVTLASDI